MLPGHVYDVSVTMRNDSTCLWVRRFQRLGSQIPADNAVWGTSRADVRPDVRG
jgi:hypothetical protein